MAGPRGKLAPLLLWFAALVGCADDTTPSVPQLSGKASTAAIVDDRAGAPSPALRAALARPVELSVRGEPLLDVLPRLAEAAGARLTVAPGAVETLESRGEPWVFAEFRATPLEYALRTLLAPFDLKLVASGDRLTVRPRIDATGPMTTRIYPIVDLVGREGGTFTEADCLEVVTCGLPGNGHFEAVPGALVVAHTDDAHAEIERLLSEIRRVADPQAAWETGEAATAPLDVRPPDVSPPNASPEQESRLAAQLLQRATVARDRLTVHQRAEWLADEHGLTLIVELDALAMELKFSGDGNIRPAVVTWDQPLGVALDRTLYGSRLDWWREGESIVIAGYGNRYERDRDRATLRIYPTADLIDGRIWTSSENVVEFISATVEPQNWDEVNGPYIVRPVPGGVFVQQTDEEHAEVASLLARLRALGDPRRETFDDPALAARRRFERILDQPAEIDWTDKPLREGLTDLLARHGIADFYFDQSAIEEAGGDLDVPLTFHLSGVTLRQALHWLLREQNGLTWIVDDGLLWITSLEFAEASLSHRMYRLPGTLQALIPSSSQAVLDALQEIVVPYSWDHVGGPGSMYLVPGGIVVSQDEYGNAELAAALASIDRLGRRDSPDEPLGGMSAEDAEIYGLLSRTVSCDIDGATLQEVVTQLAPDLACAGRIDIDEYVREEGLDHRPITLHASDVPLESALDRLLDPVGLTWTIDHGALQIVERETRVELWCYRLPDASRAGVGCSSRDVIDLLQACVAPMEWEDAGGNGEIWLLPGGMIVEESPAAQRDVRRLLGQIRPLLVDRDAPLVEVPPTEADLRLEAVLALPIGPLDADAPPDQRLDRILPLLAARHEIDLVVADANVAWRLEEPPMAASPDESLASLLDRELPPRSLGWTIADGALRVDFASTVATERRIYDARPLLRPRGRFTEAELLARIEQAIQADDFVPPISWGGLLAGFYPHRVHRQIQDLLAAEGEPP